MKRFPSSSLSAVVFAAWVMAIAAGVSLVSPLFGQFSELNRTALPTPEEVRAAFLAGPGAEYSTAPLWVWNDDLTENQIRETLGDLASQGVLQAFVHPRPGLMTPYLSNDWFRLWRAALDEAKKRGMKLWIYDENSYPSGFAGGLVPDALPGSRGRGLVFREVESLPSIENDVLFIWEKTGDGQFLPVTDAKRAEGRLLPGRWLLGLEQKAPVGGWFGGKFYVDLLLPGVTEQFLRLTHEAYRRELGDKFGTEILGIFTDEPHLAPGNALHWGDYLPAEFEKRFGYPLIDALPQLAFEIDQKLPDGSVRAWQTTRHHYYQLLLDLMIERWSRPNFDFCERNRLQWTGHYWEHGWPGSSHGSDPMAFYAWHHRPAVDILMNEWSENVHAQFGNNRAIRELRSAANQLGRARTLSETYGAGGWDLRFVDMKRIADWQFALGINTTDEHLSYITIRGARKQDHPQSFSYHAFWWPEYEAIEAYQTRLSYLMSQGIQKNPTLVLQPTTTMWLYEGSPEKQEPLGQAFADFCRALDARQVEYDLGSEDLLRRFGKAERGILTVGKADYRRVVIPEEMENLNGTTLRLLADFLVSGGELVALGSPRFLDGVPQNGGTILPEKAPTLSKNDFLESAAEFGETPRWEDASGNPIDAKNLFHHRRIMNGGEILFLANIDLEKPVRGFVTLPDSSIRRVEQLDPLLGRGTELSPSGRLAFDLPPAGSAAFLITRDDAAKQTEKIAPPAAPPTRREIPAVGPMTARRTSDNALVLDYGEAAVSGEIKADYYWRLNDFLWKKRGFPEGDPWADAVQFKDELLTRSFGGDSGFTVSYRFTLDRCWPFENAESENGKSGIGPLFAVVESAPLYERITLNGRPLTTTPGAWFLDRSFAKIDVTDALIPGENILELTAGRMTMKHELMPVLLLGDFSLEPAERGFVVQPPRPIDTAAPWCGQGLPFYSCGVEYAQTFSVNKKDVGENPRYYVKLPKLGNLDSADSAAKWNGAVAVVSVNERKIGRIFCEPGELDVTDEMTDGENRVVVEIIGTPKNLLGPHHAGKMRGKAWPGSFRQAPETLPAGGDYDVIPYGLTAPFSLLQADAGTNPAP